MDEKVFFEKALLEAMNAYHVPVTAYAVINDFEINQSNTLSIDSTISTTQESLFQVASISKVLTSLGILKLVEKDLIKLDNPANDYLTDWKIPENQFNKNNPVLVRQLLDMTSGLSISNFDGYPQNKTLPTPLELLNGNAPANNVPVEVLHQPGSDYAYSNGGFQVLQKITEELTGRSFSDYQNNEIIKALDMKNSLFEFPLNANLVSHAVPAFVGDKKIEPGGWHNFAALASCGMWSTPVDIAKLILNITHAYLGKKPAFLSKAMTTAMLTRQQNTPFGFGIVVSGHDENLNFSKTGHTKGYQSLFVMFPHLGKGVVVMTNAESGDKLIDYFVSIVAKEHQWPYYFPFFDESVFLPDY